MVKFFVNKTTKQNDHFEFDFYIDTVKTIKLSRWMK